MSGVPYTFATATTSIPLSQLDANFATNATLGNATVGLGNTTTVVGNLTLQNPTISGGTAFTLGNTTVSYGGTTTSVGNLTLTNTTISSTNGDANIHGLTVGLGNSSISTNTAVGVNTLNSNTSGANSTAVGYQSLYSNLDAGSSTALGYQSLYNSNSSGCTSVGYQSGYSNTSGSVTSFGYRANYSNTTGSSNTAIGQSSLFSNTTGSSNTAIGYQALNANTTASNNTAVGQQALYQNTTGAFNTIMGQYTGSAVTTGSYNTAIGQTALAGLTTGSYNVNIGFYSSPSSSSVNSELVISTATGQITGKGASTGFIYPNGGGVYQGNNSTTWSFTSDQRLKKNIVTNTDGLNKISQLTVRNFEYRLPEEVDPELKPTDALNISGVQLGFIAQELQAVLPDCVKTESTGVLGVNIDNVIYHMVNAIKDLNTLVTTQATTITDLETKLKTAGVAGF